MIGIGRPMCVEPELPRKMLKGELEVAPRPEDRLKMARRGFFSPASPNFVMRAINVFGAMGWYYQQLFRLADGKEPDLDTGILSDLVRYQVDELRTASRLER